MISYKDGYAEIRLNHLSCREVQSKDSFLFALVGARSKGRSHSTEGSCVWPYCFDFDVTGPISVVYTSRSSRRAIRMKLCRRMKRVSWLDVVTVVHVGDVDLLIEDGYSGIYVLYHKLQSSHLLCQDTPLVKVMHQAPQVSAVAFTEHFSLIYERLRCQLPRSLTTVGPSFCLSSMLVRCSQRCCQKDPEAPRASAPRSMRS